jgi:hypothetical protein
MPTPSRWFLPLMAARGVTMSLTAPLEVLFAREFSHSSTYIGVFMLSAGVGVIVIDVFGTRFVPSLDARVALIAGLTVFGLACIGMGVASGGILLTASRVLQGFPVPRTVQRRVPVRWGCRLTGRSPCRGRHRRPRRLPGRVHRHRSARGVRLRRAGHHIAQLGRA